MLPCVEPLLRQTARHSPQLYSELEKTVYSAERSHRIMQLATGPLMSRTTSGLPASRRQRHESLSRGGGDETAVAETSDRSTHVLGHENVRREHRFRCVASRIIRSPRCVWSGLNTRWVTD